MKSLLGRLRSSRLASTFIILATLSAGILIGSFVTHGVRGQESKVDTSDATPLKIPSPRDLSTDFTRIANQVSPAVVNINTITLPKQRDQSRGRNPHSRQFQPQQPPDDNGDDDDQDDQGQGNFQDFFNRFFGGQGGIPDEGGQERALSSTLVATSSPTITSSTRPTGSSSASPPIPMAGTFRAARQKS